MSKLAAQLPLSDLRARGIAGARWPAASVAWWKQRAVEAHALVTGGKSLDAVRREAVELFPAAELISTTEPR